LGELVKRKGNAKLEEKRHIKLGEEILRFRGRENRVYLIWANFRYLSQLKESNSIELEFIQGGHGLPNEEKGGRRNTIEIRGKGKHLLSPRRITSWGGRALPKEGGS